MKAFVCVYRHGIPTATEWRRTQQAAATLPALNQFLQTYQSPTCFYDWGDDPSFYSASTVFGDVRRASWGVCRRNVRSQLQVGDFVLWFCGQQDLIQRAVWHYYFIGCTTVARVIDRFQLWNDLTFYPYRNFYNVLARPQGPSLVQHETFHSYHKDWQRRAAAPYIIFDHSPTESSVNITNPVKVAIKHAGNATETWLSPHSPRVQAIENAIFNSLAISRRLRSTNPYISHPQIPLHKAARGTVTNLSMLKSTIIPLV